MTLEKQIEPIEKKIETEIKGKIIDSDNPEHRLFIMDVLDHYGYPQSTTNCLNSKDKILYVYGVMNIVNSVKKAKDIFLNCSEIPSSSRAEFFCRNFYDRFFEHVIPEDKDSSPLIKTADLIKGTKKDEKQDRLDVSRAEEES
tara:strand:- start:43 stop:471 length:429 start_codon:yes stop_codon:yes gene_type:complete